MTQMRKIFLILSVVLTNSSFAQQLTMDSLINIGGCFVDTEMPQFIGGMDSLKNFISKHFNLTVDKNCAEGRIYLKFAVEEDGVLTNIKVMRGLSDKLDAEAIRVLNIMPKWKPATSNGKPIRMFINLPLKVG